MVFAAGLTRLLVLLDWNKADLGGGNGIAGIGRAGNGNIKAVQPPLIEDRWRAARGYAEGRGSADRDVGADGPCAENGRGSNRTSRRKFRSIVVRISCGGGDGLCVSRREGKCRRKGSNAIAECRNVSRAD